MWLWFKICIISCSHKKRYRLGCTSHRRGAKKVHRDQISLEALVSTYYGKKTEKAKRQLKTSLFPEICRCTDSSYDQRARSYQASASPEIKLRRLGQVKRHPPHSLPSSWQPCRPSRTRSSTAS